MESTRPIRALIRGFDALTVLNMRDGASVSEVAQEIRLPRTTAYRILETLCTGGFVLRDPVDDKYRLTSRVKRLSSGFTDEAWVTRIATPRLIELGNELVWPVSVATLVGGTMMLRESTDHATPLAIERLSAGIRLPLLSSAAGRVYLACCPPAQCGALLDQLAHSNQEDAALARAPRPELLRALAAIRDLGYATTTRTRRMVEEISLSVPVTAGDRILAALTVRFVSSAVPSSAGIERFLPKLRQSAAMIGAGLLDQTDAVVATP